MPLPVGFRGGRGRHLMPPEDQGRAGGTSLSQARRSGAKTRRGTAFLCPAMRNGRCRLRGAKRTRPRTAAGLERGRRARWIHGRYSLEAREARWAGTNDATAYRVRDPCSGAAERSTGRPGSAQDPGCAAAHPWAGIASPPVTKCSGQRAGRGVPPRSFEGSVQDLGFENYAPATGVPDRLYVTAKVRSSGTTGARPRGNPMTRTRVSRSVPARPVRVPETWSRTMKPTPARRPWEHPS